MRTDLEAVAARIHAGLDDLLALTCAPETDPADVLLVVGGPRRENLSEHLARVLEAVGARRLAQEGDTGQAVEWVEQAHDDLVDRVAGDGVERALLALS